MRPSEPRQAPAKPPGKRKYSLSAAGRAALQAAAAGRKPWLKSTGPRTKAGATRSAMNAMQHGDRSVEVIERRRVIRSLLRRVRELNRDGSQAGCLPPVSSAPVGSVNVAGESES